MASASVVRIVRVSELVGFLMWNEDDLSDPISARMISAAVAWLSRRAVAFQALALSREALLDSRATGPDLVGLLRRNEIRLQLIVYQRLDQSWVQGEQRSQRAPGW